VVGDRHSKEGRRTTPDVMGRDAVGATCGWRAGGGKGFAFFGMRGKVSYRNTVLEGVFFAMAIRERKRLIKIFDGFISRIAELTCSKQDLRHIGA
jgi:hypothetical protein